jgi:hypothetical protein
VFVLEYTDEIKVLPLKRKYCNPKATTPDGCAARAAGFSIQVYRRMGLGCFAPLEAKAARENTAHRAVEA